MTKNEVNRKMYRNCHRVGYLHLGMVDGMAKMESRGKRGMSKEQFKKKMLGDLGDGKVSD